MLRLLLDLSLRHRGIVIALAAALVAWSAWAAAHARLDVLPDFVPPQVVVQTEAPGLSAEQVELMVTRPLEASLNGAIGLASLRSQSIQGLSIITAVFEDGTDVFRARQWMSEMLAAAASALPDAVHAPRMTPLTSATMDLLKIGLLSDHLTPMELRSFAQWTLRPRLLSVPGVAGVSVFGGEIERTEVQVRPERMAAFDVTFDEVVAAAKSSTGVRPAGFVESSNQRIVLRSDGQFEEPEQLARTVVAERDGRIVTLGEVADVGSAPEPMFGDCLIQGKPGVLLTMLSQYGSNTMEVTRGVEEALDEMRPTFAAAGIELLPRLHRPATFIENALRNLGRSVALGGVLVVLVLLVFLYDLRAAFISLTAIPLSLGAALLVLHQLGATLNTITIGGFAIALGEVVDDAIIDVENVFRRLRENRGLAAPRPAMQVVFEACFEVRSAVVYATVIVALVFVPVITMSGLQGRMFAPLGEAYILATLASLLVALTVTPALCLVLLPKAAAEPREPALLRWMRARYSATLEACMRHRKTVYVLATVACLAVLALLPFFGGEFLPDFREGHLVLHASAVPGTSLQEMKRIGARISAELLRNPHIATAAQQIGRAELGEDPWGPHRSEFHVELAPLAPSVEAGVADEVRTTLASFPGIRYDVLTFLGDRIGETISGETASVVVDVFGEDLEMIERKSGEIARVLSGIRGAADVQTAALPGVPDIESHLRLDRMQQFGLRPVDVLEAIETAYQGRVVAQTWHGNRIVDVAVILAPKEREEPESIGALRLRGAGGASVPLSELADLLPESSRALLLHDGGRRRQTVTCNVQGRDVASFVQEARRAVDERVPLPLGSYVQFSGEAKAQAEAQRELLLHTTAAGFLILLVLSLALRDRRHLALVLANLPFALTGGILAAWVDGHSLSLGSLVGFVTLFGITTRNSLMLLSHYDHLVRVEGFEWNAATAVLGAAQRFVPIAMTALVTGLALLPLALASNAAGREIEGPMAAVILGGLATSTALNLIVLPSLALRWGRFHPAR